MAYNSDYLALTPVNYVGKLGKKIWNYDTADVTGTVDGASYFADGAAKGMEPGDIVIVTIWDTAVPATQAAKLAATVADAALHVVISVSGDAATVSAETALSVAAGS